MTGEDIDAEPTDPKTVKIDLPPGTYPFVCTFHSAQGMGGTLKVS